jgi:glyoxylase-like metal-dependent hydrolase (beta-lactamase superfamily II)
MGFDTIPGPGDCRSGMILLSVEPMFKLIQEQQINKFGGLKAIIISHPHYYSTWVDWSRTFNCPVYVGAPDEEWFERRDTPGAEVRLLTEPYTPILPNEVEGVTAILTGGHFPGSLLLHWNGILCKWGFKPPLC